MCKSSGENQKNKVAIQLIMAMLLVYPLVFSFSHVLSHHLFVPHHSRSSIAENVQSVFSAKSNFNRNVHYGSSIEECPICEYEFAPAIEPEQAPVPQVAIALIVIDFPLKEQIIVQQRCNSVSPRAPPRFS